MHKTVSDLYTVGQITKLTGISSRALQYYDEIGLLKPRMRTESGYRLYDKSSLELLQQILFFKELGFSLKQIRDLTKQPDFDRISAYRNQKNLLLLKRNRIDRLIELLNRLEKGESCMSFKEFDLSEYLEALEQFKTRDTKDVYKRQLQTASRSVWPAPFCLHTPALAKKTCRSRSGSYSRHCSFSYT